MIEEIKKIKITEVEKQIEELQTELTSNKYGWLAKTITRKKEYNEWYKSIEEQIQSLQTELESIKAYQSLKDLNMSFEEGINLLQTHGIDPVLDENDIRHSAAYKSKPDIDNIDGLAMVHKRSHPPKNDLIQTSKSAGIMTKKVIEIGDERKEIPVHNYRDTIHFAVNGEVSTFEGQPWFDSKYAEIIPMKDFLSDVIDKEQANLSAGSAFKIGDVALSKESVLLVPESEIAEQKKNNPTVTVIGYKGPNVSNYSNAVLAMQGYTVESMDTGYKWKDKEDDYKYSEFINKMGYAQAEHVESKAIYVEQMFQVMEVLDAYINTLSDNPNMLQNEETAQKLTEQIGTVFYGLTSVGTGISKEKAITDIANNLESMYNVHLSPETIESIKGERLESAYRKIGENILQDLTTKIKTSDISRTM